MLKNKSKIFILFITCVVLLSTVCFATVEPTTTSAEETSATQTAENTAVENTDATNDTSTDTSSDVSTDTTSAWTNSDLYLTGDKVSVSNVVDGNAFIFANEVTIESTAEIGGDLFVCASKLTVNGGYVYSSIFAFANEISINGVVYDVYAACTNFTLESNGFVYRDLKVSADHVAIEGKVRRNAFITANDITFGEYTDTTYIYGNLSYTSPNELSVEEGMIAGEVTRQETSATSSSPVSYITNALSILLITFIVVLLLIWLAPNFVKRVTNMGIAKSFASLGIGIATPIVAILVGLLLILSIVGVTVFSSMFVGLVFLAMLATSITSLFVAGLLAKAFKKTSNVTLVLFTLISSLVLWGLGFIPYIGWFLSIIFVLFGIGTTLVNIVYTKEGTRKEKKVAETSSSEETK